MQVVADGFLKVYLTFCSDSSSRLYDSGLGRLFVRWCALPNIQLYNV
jgi:hypothetical protein